MSCRYNRVRAIFFVLSLFLLPACKQDGIRRDLKRMMSKPVVMPSLLGKVQGDSVFFCEMDACAKCIIYIDSTECSSCKIGHLPRYNALYNLLNSDYSYDLLVVISPKAKEREWVIRQLQFTMGFPVYLDDGSRLLSLNTFIPHDNRFHCFLTDANGKVVFVGDPTWGDTTNTYFLEVLNQLSSAEDEIVN